VLSLRINHLVKPFLLQACMSLFPLLAKYFMYSHLPYFLYIAAMLCSRCEACVHVLATGGMLVSIDRFWLQVRLL
jgi:hypothetical protein